MFSQRFIQNASYLKIANVELGYNFPNNWFGGKVSGVRVYASAHRITSYNVCYTKLLRMRGTLVLMFSGVHAFKRSTLLLSAPYELCNVTSTKSTALKFAAP